MSRFSLPTALVALLLWAGLLAPAMAAPPNPTAQVDLPSPSRAPLGGAVLTDFNPPAQDWLPGHRGVDLAGNVGDVVRASAKGTVTFAGNLAGRGVIVVSHGKLRTTYEPVSASVRVGDTVQMGDPLGTLQAGHPSCAPRTCLHWGLREGERYLDPTLLGLGSAGDDDVRLVDAGRTDRVQREAAQREAAQREADRRAAQRAAQASGQGPAGPPGGDGDPVPVRPGSWHTPVPGPITSPFGMRVHPVTGIYKLHDGTDYGAPCGTPIRSPLGGRVTLVEYHRAYGWRVIVDHGQVRGRKLVTSSTHATRFIVGQGQTVQAGQVLGYVGSTGWSTGCHLHFMAWQDGRLVNPATLG